jgi:hypothetical protein
LKYVFFGQNTEIVLTGAGNFQGCKNLLQVESVFLRDITISAFRDCNNLQSISISGNANLEERCFLGCNNLDTLYFDNIRTLNIANDTYHVLKSKTLYCDKNAAVVQDLAYEGFSVHVN